MSEAGALVTPPATEEQPEDNEATPTHILGGDDGAAAAVPDEGTTPGQVEDRSSRKSKAQGKAEKRVSNKERPSVEAEARKKRREKMKHAGQGIILSIVRHIVDTEDAERNKFQHQDNRQIANKRLNNTSEKDGPPLREIICGPKGQNDSHYFPVITLMHTMFCTFMWSLCMLTDRIKERQYEKIGAAPANAFIQRYLGGAGGCRDLAFELYHNSLTHSFVIPNPVAYCIEMPLFIVCATFVEMRYRSKVLGMLLLLFKVIGFLLTFFVRVHNRDSLSGGFPTMLQPLILFVCWKELGDLVYDYNVSEEDLDAKADAKVRQKLDPELQKKGITYDVLYQMGLPEDHATVKKDWQKRYSELHAARRRAGFFQNRRDQWEQYGLWIPKLMGFMLGVVFPLLTCVLMILFQDGLLRGGHAHYLTFMATGFFSAFMGLMLMTTRFAMFKKFEHRPTEEAETKKEITAEGAEMAPLLVNQNVPVDLAETDDEDDFIEGAFSASAQARNSAVTSVDEDGEIEQKKWELPEKIYDSVDWDIIAQLLYSCYALALMVYVWSVSFKRIATEKDFFGGPEARSSTSSSTTFSPTTPLYERDLEPAQF
ncbi:unnamed protein product [Amoebophrya sp. A120]|nr:unnamed protein product [Amoebophrya sp. A120]|eukprot:GSA120T00003097001.1